MARPAARSAETAADRVRQQTRRARTVARCLERPPPACSHASIGAFVPAIRIWTRHIAAFAERAPWDPVAHRPAFEPAPRSRCAPHRTGVLSLVGIWGFGNPKPRSPF